MSLFINSTLFNNDPHASPIQKDTKTWQTFRSMYFRCPVSRSFEWCTVDLPRTLSGGHKTLQHALPNIYCWGKHNEIYLIYHILITINLCKNHLFHKHFAHMTAPSLFMAPDRQQQDLHSSGVLSTDWIWWCHQNLDLLTCDTEIATKHRFAKSCSYHMFVDTKTVKHKMYISYACAYRQRSTSPIYFILDKGTYTFLNDQ